MPTQNMAAKSQVPILRSKP